MSKLGVGVIIKRLFGDNSATVAAYHAAVGRKIAAVDLSDEGDGHCLVTFIDGTSLKIYDDGRSCCESRYVTCDDDLSTFSGATLVGIELKDGGDEEDGCGDIHETQFCEVQTDNGCFLLVTHNEHNGYYGGFDIELRFSEATHDPA